MIWRDLERMWRVRPIRRLTLLAILVGSTLGTNLLLAPWMRSAHPEIAADLSKLVEFQLFRVGTFELSARLLLQVSLFLTGIWLTTHLVTRFVLGNILALTRLGEGRRYSLQRIVAYTVFALGSLVALQSLGLDLSSLAVFGGVLGIGIGLGFQSMAKNFASGLLMLVEQPVKVGDRIAVRDVQGDIVRIGARGTWVRTNDNHVLIIPNSEFVDGTVTNFTVNDRIVRIRVPIGVSYGCDPEQVRSILIETARKAPDVLDNPRPSVIFLGFGDSSLDFELRIHTTRQVTTPRVIRSEMYFAAFSAFKREGIEIPFPQRDLHLRTASPDIEWKSAPESESSGQSDESLVLPTSATNNGRNEAQERQQ